MGRIKSIEIGKYKVPGVIANFPDPDSYMDTLKASRLVFRNGSLGGEMLSRFTVTLNFPGERIYLKKNASLKKEFFFNLSGITVRALGAKLKSFEISNVRVNSQAEKAGIKIGDKVMSVNGLSTTELDLSVINGILNSKPGKKIVLQIQREGKRMRKEFRLENAI